MRTYILAYVFTDFGTLELMIACAYACMITCITYRSRPNSATTEHAQYYI